jgi:hypothetical protein
MSEVWFTRNDPHEEREGDVDRSSTGDTGDNRSGAAWPLDVEFKGVTNAVSGGGELAELLHWMNTCAASLSVPSAS